MDRPYRRNDSLHFPAFRVRKGLVPSGSIALAIVFGAIFVGPLTSAQSQEPGQVTTLPPAPSPVNGIGRLSPAASQPSQTTASPVISNPSLSPAPDATQPRVIQPRSIVPPPPRPAVSLPDALTGSASDSLLHEVGSPQRELVVFVNSSKIFELAPDRKLTRALVDNPKVADVQLLDQAEPNPHILNLSGMSFGRATLTIWDDRGQVSSFPVRVIIDEKELEKRLRTVFPGADVTVRQVAMQIILEGEVPDTKTMVQVLELVQSELRLTGQISTGSLAGSVGVGGNASTAAGGSSAGGSNQSIMSQGQSPLGLATPANSQPGLIIVNRVRVPGPRQILLAVKIAELNRTALRQIGVSWLDTRNNAMLGSTIGNVGTVGAAAGVGQGAAYGPAGLLPGVKSGGINNSFRLPQFQPVTSTFGATGTASSLSSNLPQLFGVFNAGEFNIFLNALRVNSLAKILAEPNLVTLDGQPAQFQAGGQFPYPVAQGTSIAGGGAPISIQFANFGAILEFLPHIQETGMIRLDVAPTFSELNYAQGTALPGVGTVPGINQRTAHTIVEMREGQTLAIAGLLQTVTNATTSRIPGLGDLPLVGMLFSSNQYQTVETELVVLVTPRLVAPMERNEVPPSPGDRVLEPNDAEFYFLGRIEGKTGHPHRSTVQEQDPINVMKHHVSEAQWVIGPHGYAE